MLAKIIYKLDFYFQPQHKTKSHTNLRVTPKKQVPTQPQANYLPSLQAGVSINMPSHKVHFELLFWDTHHLPYHRLPTSTIFNIKVELVSTVTHSSNMAAFMSPGLGYDVTECFNGNFIYGQTFLG